MKPSRTLVVHPYGGLGNRIRCLGPALELASRHDLAVTVIWEANRFLNCPYDRLFVRHPNIRRVVSLPFAEGLSRLLGRVLSATGYPYLDDKKIRSGALDAASFAPRTLPTYIHSCYQFGPPDSRLGHLFPPAPEILRSVESFIPTGTPLVGLHIRRGDNANASSFSPLELFVQAMESELRQNPESKFFLASDSPSTESELTERFGPGRILWRPKVLDRGAESGIVDAWIDLLLLSRCSKIYGSFYSSFSDIASRIGDCPLEVLRSETPST